MHLNTKKVVIIVGLVCCFGTNFADQYYGSPINRKANQIRTKFINQPSILVAAKNKPSLSDEFEGFLTNDKIMQKIKKINVEGSSETTLDVTDLEENIAENWTQKEKELKNQHGWCWPKQIVSGILTVVGGVAVGIGQSQHNQKSEIAIAGAGALTCLVGVVGLYVMAGEKERLAKHIVQVQIMHKNWNEFFVVPEQK